MAIFDLTGGKYPLIINQSLRTAVYEFKDADTIYQQRIESQERDEMIPIFLVETTQSKTLVTVPETQCAVLVPKDKTIQTTETNKEESFFNRLRLWELVDLSDRIDATETKNRKVYLSVVDFLGVYISDSDPFVPKRVFIWVDKINQCANGDVENAYALLLQVIFHELAHSFMDVTRLGKRHNTLFTYNHPAYRFIEEALANGISLHLSMRCLSAKQQSFLEQFTLSQPVEYSEGIPIIHAYKKYYVERVGLDWRRSKVHTNKMLLNMIFKVLSNFNSGAWLSAFNRGLQVVIQYPSFAK